MGERVQCVVLGLDSGFSNISLSTAELEPADGDILHNRQACWDGAAQQAQLYREHLTALREDGFDFEAYAMAEGV